MGNGNLYRKSLAAEQLANLCCSQHEVILQCKAIPAILRAIEGKYPTNNADDEWYRHWAQVQSARGITALARATKTDVAIAEAFKEHDVEGCLRTFVAGENLDLNGWLILALQTID